MGKQPEASAMTEPIPAKIWGAARAETTEKGKTVLAKKKTGTRGFPTTFRLQPAQRRPCRRSKRKKEKR